MAMKSEEVQVACPVCGNERIVEWSRVLSFQDFDRVVRTDDGVLDVTDWGASEMIWEDNDPLGFSCSELCEGPDKFFPLEHFVVDNA